MVKGEARGNTIGQGHNQGQPSQSQHDIMSCENCSVNFTIFKRKVCTVMCGVLGFMFKIDLTLINDYRFHDLLIV